MASKKERDGDKMCQCGNQDDPSKLHSMEKCTEREQWPPRIETKGS